MYLNYIGPVEADAKVVDNIGTLILTTFLKQLSNIQIKVVRLTIFWWEKNP